MPIGRAVVFVLVLCSVTAGNAQQPSRLPFLAVQPRDYYRVADLRLTDELNRTLRGGPTSIDRPSVSSDYGDLINDVVTREDAFLARMTPYAYVAARMLGARVDAIATYLRPDDTSAGRSFVSTYRSYFVVNATPFKQSTPTLEDVFQFVKASADAGKPARFTYTQQFSTSGFFVPALWMRSRHIFATDDDSMGIVRIASDPLRGFDSVISAVEGGGADFAAVWDKDKSEYERGHPAQAGVRFIPLPWVLPNDLLVCSRSVDTKTRASIGDAIGKMHDIDLGDFHSWKQIQEPEASDALRAVAELERVAAAPPAPVVVDIQAAPGAETYLDEARQAVRLSGTEFVLFDRYFHHEEDVVWKLDKVHDGSVALTTAFKDTSLKSKNQRFQISFTDAEGDLATRVVALIHSRMHRIRYVWPYEQSPTVIRDIDVSIPAGTTLQAQKIVWTDPDRNEYKHGQTTPLIVQPQSNAYKFTLAGSITGFDNPLSNVAYRVVLERRSNESLEARVLTVTLLGLMGMTAVGLVFDLRRKVKPAPLARRTLRDVCSALASKTHDRWRGYTLKDAELITCERARVEELIEELKGKGLVTAKTAGVTKWAYEVSGSLSIPILRGILGGGLQSSRRVELTSSPDKFGDTARLSALIDLLVEERLLSLFVGRPLEWDALNELASGILTPSSQPLRLERLVRAEDTTVVDLASQHFNQVLDGALKRVSLFSGTWTITSTERGTLMRQLVVLDGPLWVGHEHKEVTTLNLEFHVPGKELTAASDDTNVECWLLGKVVRLTYVEPRELCVHFRTLAAIAAEGITPKVAGSFRDSSSAD